MNPKEFQHPEDLNWTAGDLLMLAVIFLGGPVIFALGIGCLLYLLAR